MPPCGKTDCASPERPAATIDRGWVAGLVVCGGLLIGAILLQSRSSDPSQGGLPLSEQAANNAEPLGDKLRELAELRRGMEGLEANTRAQFLAYASRGASHAMADASSLQAETAKAQAEIAAVLDSSTSDLDRFVAMRSNASFDRLYAAHQLTRQRLVTIAARQEEIMGILSLCGDKQAAAARAQQAAIDAQARVGEALKKLDEARDVARGSRQRTPDEGQYEHVTYHFTRAENRIAEKPGEIEELNLRLATLNAMADRLEAALKSASPTDATALESQRAVVQSEQATLKEQLKSDEKQLADAQKNLEKLRSRVMDAEVVLAGQAQPATEADLTLRKLHGELAALQKEAGELQHKAQLAPAAVEASAPPEAELLEALGTASTPAGTMPAEDNLQACYDYALLTDQAIAASYHRQRAMDLAMTRRIPLRHAFAMSELPPAKRAQISFLTASTARSTSAANWDFARGQITAILRSGHAMLNQASNRDRDPALTDDSGSGAKVLDLTASRQPGILLPGGPGGPPAPPATGSSIPAFPGSAGQAPGPAQPWSYVDHWQILGPFDNPHRENIDTRFPPESLVDLDASYSGKNGVSIGWESFQSVTPNVMPPFRAYNQARKIEGLNEEMSYRFNLQYAVYYAYAEVTLEKAADLWVAIGSDDHSKIWLNDRLVWSGGKGAKPWRADEGYRKVHFREGINRILYRIENGNDRTEFSLLLGTGN
ncbi:hypothetical protein [Haloferula sp. BvORR071]|uniref:hypothetical protein n=1 Tax=Haloferula sp. BvORR071 TaxID=1396141 RepID=UPI002240FAD3|nr:hypothetical protein [Haloferula sp. BvORR071]